MPGVFAAARQAGAKAVFLSGAGPAVLAFATERFEAIGAAMVAAGRTAGVPGVHRTLRLAVRGTHVLKNSNS